MAIVHLQEPLSISSIWRSQTTHVVALGLEPIHWLLGTLVALGKIASAPEWVSTTSRAQAGLGRYLFGTSGFIRLLVEVEPVTLHRKPFMYTAGRMNDISHTALKNTLTLGRTAVLGMDPMPRTDAAVFGTSRHVLWNLEGSVDSPNALVVNTENGQILRLDAVHVGGVCNGEGTTLQVIVALGGNISVVLNRASEVEETHVSYKKSLRGQVKPDRKWKIWKNVLCYTKRRPISCAHQSAEKKNSRGTGMLGSLDNYNRPHEDRCVHRSRPRIR